MKDVDEQFRVDEDGYTSDGYRRLEPVSKKSMYLGNVIVLAILAAVLALIAMNADRWFAENADFVSIACWALIIVSAAYLLVSPEVKYRRYRYRIDDDKLEIRRGVITIVHEMVPVERIHQVDVSKGPINRMFGLADVTVTTAGGIVTLEYLQEDVAEDVASKLNESVVLMLKERE
ncbi:MAG: PH domain-containing protein [Thermoplasmata archaeon]|nr:PH domain-containing protein [Thermoplasmata archaeon]